MAHERDHDLGDRVAAGALDRDLRIQDGPRLDLHEVRDHQAKADAAQPQHRVLLVHRLDRPEQLAVLVGRAAVLVCLGHLDELIVEVRQELVQRRIDQPDHDRQRIHGLEDALEVALLEDLQLGHRGIERRDGLALVGAQRLAGGGLRLGPGRDTGNEDRAAHDLQPVTLAEHVLGSAQADALGTIAARLGGLLWLVRVRPDAHAPDLVRPAEDRLELRLVLEPRLDRRECTQVEVARRAVEAQPGALGKVDAGDRACGRLVGVVHVQGG